ncbi:MAG: four helix bundle protein [Saprospiraceae bacterium]|nr:four helix bundle protein [Lewinellaceae bacterium]
MKPTVKSAGPLRSKTMFLAMRIFKLSKYLTDTKYEFVISKQILRSGTNPGAMVREAENAESGADFIHKFSVAQKETGETQYWLELLLNLELIDSNQYNSMFNDTEEIMNLLISSIKTRRKTLNSKAKP